MTDMTLATHDTTVTTDADSWADLSGRWFFAWRMAAACEGALKEVHVAITGQHDPSRAQALERVSTLLERELMRWVRRGEALDMIVEHLPRQPE
jgi:peptidoglycan/xylan/chitin deacetylase (PgdA/CDA1 family)